MNWYGNLSKYAASPKNIINSWKVDDPFLKFFIYTYEPLIDLNKVKSQEDLKQHIQQVLIPSLKEKIDPNSSQSYYKKKMTDEEALGEFNAHPHDHRMQAARRVYDSNPEAAKETMLRAVNEDKKHSFDKWWDYMYKDYKDNPAFLYSMLNPMIESSPASQKNGPPPAHREAVSEIEKEIGDKGVTQMNVFKKFNKISFVIDKDGSESIDIDDNKCWIRVDSGVRDRGNYKSNQEKLMRFSTDSGWCTAQPSMSDTYLKKGDFWLYFENKRPKSAIRLLGDKKVEEIRGLYNKEKTLDPYWEPVTTFLHNTDFDYTNNSFYKRLKDIMFKNVDLEKNPEAYKSLLNAIKNDPKQIGIVSNENRRKFPELVRTAAVGYEKKMNKLLDAVEQIPPTGNEYQRRFSRFQDEFNDIPEDVRVHMSDAVEGRLISVHKGAFSRNPLEYENFPEDIQAAITDDEKRTSWTNYVGNDPYRYNDLRIPEEIRRYIPIRPIVDSWKRLVDLNIDHADNMPAFIMNLLPDNYVEDKIVEDFKRYPCNRNKKGYDKLKRVVSKGLMSEEQIIETYVEAVHRNANIFRYVPPQYQELIKNNLQDISPISKKHLEEVVSDATYFNAIPDPDIRNYLLNNQTDQVIASFVRLKQRYGGDLNGYWKAIPEDVQPYMPDNIKEEVANFFLPYVQKNPDFLSKISPILHPYITNKMASISSWYGRLIRA